MYFISRYLFIVLISLVAGYNADAQTNKINYPHNAFWGRVVFTDKLSNKLKWEFLIQERTQNDPVHDKLNIFKYHQLRSYWFWLHYQLFKDVRVSVSPFCYFNSIGLLPQSADVGNRGVKEWRWAVGLEHTNKLKHFQLAHRYNIEYRYRDLFKENDFIGSYRIRYRAKLEKSLKKEGKQFNVILYDELMVEFGKALRTSPAIFNQNRLYAGFSYELVKNVKFNLGYMYIIQERQSGRAVDNSNVIWAIVTFDNLFTQFFKKKEPAETNK